MVNTPSITLGDRPLSSQAALRAAGAIVDLIDGGSSWLSWAIANPSVRHHYARRPRTPVHLPGQVGINRVVSPA